MSNDDEQDDNIDDIEAGAREYDAFLKSITDALEEFTRGRVDHESTLHVALAKQLATKALCTLKPVPESIVGSPDEVLAELELRRGLSEKPATEKCAQAAAELEEAKLRLKAFTMGRSVPERQMSSGRGEVVSLLIIPQERPSFDQELAASALEHELVREVLADMQARKLAVATLDVTDDDQLLLDGKPYRYAVADRNHGRRALRCLTLLNNEGRLFVALVRRGAPPADMNGNTLKKSLYYLREAIGRENVVGRGRDLALSDEFRKIELTERLRTRLLAGSQA